MGSTGEPDRKRRHFGSISPTAAATPKKQPFLPISEDKKLDITVLQYQNQKLVQKLEAQKVESFSLENKFSLLKLKQQPYDSTLAVVNKSLDKLVNDLESFSIKTRELSSEQDGKHLPVIDDGVPSTFKDAFLSRLIETGATENSSTYNCANHVKEDSETATEKTQNILHNIVAAIDNLWYLKDGLSAAVWKELPEDGACRQKTSHDLEKEVKNLRMEFSDLHLKHKSLARELQRHQNVHAKNKAEMKHLREELEVALSELEENNCNLASLKAQRNAAKGAFFPILNLGNNQGAGDRVRDTQKDLHDMESTLKELTDQASCRLTELKGLHDERIKILQHLSSLQSHN